MSNGSQLFKIDPATKQANPARKVDFAQLGFKEKQDIQEWIISNPSILGEELLVVAKEFSAFDKEGNLVIVESKRDDTGADVHWQAVKDASYFQRAGPDHVVNMLSIHANISKEEAAGRLEEYLDSGDLQDPNSDQRIILASHRFAPEVT